MRLIQRSTFIKQEFKLDHTMDLCDLSWTPLPIHAEFLSHTFFQISALWSFLILWVASTIRKCLGCISICPSPVGCLCHISHYFRHCLCAGLGTPQPLGPHGHRVVPRGLAPLLVAQMRNGPRFQEYSSQLKELPLLTPHPQQLCHLCLCASSVDNSSVNCLAGSDII